MVVKIFPYCLVRQAALASDVLSNLNDDAKAAQVILDFCDNPILVEGLQVSSPELHFALQKFKHTNPDNWLAKERKIARAVARYLTRICTKTSPFATFTNVGMATLGEQLQLSNYQDIIQLKKAKLSTNNVNNNMNNVDKITFIVINKSILLKNDEYTFVQNIGNVEIVHMTAYHVILAWLIQELSILPLTISDIIQGIQSAFEVDEDDVKAYLESLLDIGFLIYKSNGNYYINDIDNQNVNSIIYIDSFIKDTLELPRSPLADLANRLQKIYDFCAKAFYKKSTADVISFYKNNFKNADAVPFWTFYEHFYTSYQVVKFEVAEDEFEKQTILDFVTQNARIDQDVIHLDSALLESPMDDNQGNAALLMPFQKDAKTMWVLNAATPGFGRLFRRFLEPFPSVAEALKLFNQVNNNSQTEYVCLADESRNNVNHGPLLQSKYLGHSVLTDILLSNCRVELDADDKLKLFDNQQQKYIIPLDMALEHPSHRAASYQLLTAFAPPTATHQPLLDACNAAYGSVQKTGWMQPRIMLDDDIVLQRKSWFFAKSDLPLRHRLEPIKDYQTRLLAWASLHSLPSVFFISIHQRIFWPLCSYDVTDINPEMIKPQYIDLQSTILCDVLDKALLKVPYALSVTEALPMPSQYIDQKANEILLQWRTCKDEE